MTRTRPGRARLPRWVTLVLALGLALLGLSIAPTTARAAADSIDSWEISYTVQPSGEMLVKEVVVWRFGSNSGRHGITRDLVTREPYDDQYDQEYRISNIQVTALNGVSSRVATSTSSSGRNAQMRIRVGDANRTISAPTATYTISYTVRGALRSFSSYDELYWDATTSGAPQIGRASVRVSVPGGAQGVTCSVAAPGQKGTCATARVEGQNAVFAQTNVPAGQLLTIGVKIKSGQVSDPKPILVKRADAPVDPAETQAFLTQIGGGLGVGAIAAPLLAWLWWRRNGRDFRFAGLAPGTLPPRGTTPDVVRSSSRIEIPVAFSPPKISVAEAGYLIDGKLATRETTATLVSLAVRGALQLSNEDGLFQVRVINPNLAEDNHERPLLDTLTASAPIGQWIDLTAHSSLTKVHERLMADVSRTADQAGWFARKPGPSGCLLGCAFFLLVPLAFVVVGFVAGVLPSNMRYLGGAAAAALIPVGIALAIVRARGTKGQRGPVGRALTDQTEGFYQYLKTAEADQLRFEEGEDIFSKYLPWAIAFGIAERWAKVCRELVAMGRLQEAPTWYYGDPSFLLWNIGTLDSSVGYSVAPPPATSSDSGWGGGSSSFDGGGFSGGGGGGGDIGSW